MTLLSNPWDKSWEKTCLYAFFCNFIPSNHLLTRLRIFNHKWKYYNNIQGLWFIAYYMQSLITCKFTSVISCVHVSEREAGLNLALYLSNTSPEWWRCVLRILIDFLRKVLLSVLSILKKTLMSVRFSKRFLFAICSPLLKKAVEVLASSISVKFWKLKIQNLLLLSSLRKLLIVLLCLDILILISL